MTKSPDLDDAPVAVMGRESSPVSTAAHQAARRYLATEPGHLLVTGRAGTGKSTFLSELRGELTEEHVVLAPTGLAAVNVGGQTIHSFFSFPPRLVGPGDIRRSRNGQVMRRLKLLIIDEVSMVRSDLMHAIDLSLRLNRGRPREPFGGVRLILFGDPHQLPPVVQEHDVAQHLDDMFGGPFFFSCEALRDGPGTSFIELTQVFRQRDETLISILNAVREGYPSRDDLELLNAQVKPLRTLSEADSYVILTPTNAQARRINLAYLDALGGQQTVFEASVSGDVSEAAHPTDQALVLKPGAKVMMLRNDPDRRWVNGTIARVRAIDGKSVSVEINGRTVEIEPVAWEFRRYAYDQKAEKIVETVAGTFKQLPLRLAWALTIHKSQGLTLDRVYIDFGRGTFAHGQAYVALSRCRTLEGLALARPLATTDIVFDPAALAYREKFPSLDC